MTDRELLELAAKAAEVEILFDTDGDSYRIKQSGNRQYWNPLDDDGDAFRLAVKLHLLWDNLELFDMYFDNELGFSCEVTRKAIVRAAAEIGRNMK